jgi:hypothetical protein
MEKLCTLEITTVAGRANAVHQRCGLSYRVQGMLRPAREVVARVLGLASPVICNFSRRTSHLHRAYIVLRLTRHSYITLKYGRRVNERCIPGGAAAYTRMERKAVRGSAGAPGATSRPGLFQSYVCFMEAKRRQLDSLRGALPSLVVPLLQRDVTKVEMFARVKKSAVQATSRLGSFRESWTSEQTQQSLERSKASLEKDGNLNKAIDVPRWGWSAQ